MKIKNKKRRKIICVASCVVLLFIVCLLVIYNIEKNSPDYNLKELLKKFNCTFIKQKESSVENVKIDIYLKFGKELYEGEKSNERYFIDLIQTLAKFEKYQNFRLVDEEKQIYIVALADENKTMLDKIYINGQSNYFGNSDSKLALKNQVEPKITHIQILSKEVNSLIKNGWQRKAVDFGTRETIYEDYYYYFDEGIKVKIIAAKVYNIIFTSNYKTQVVKGITTAMNQEEVISSLGTPNFGKKRR